MEPMRRSIALSPGIIRFLPRERMARWCLLAGVLGSLRLSQIFCGFLVLSGFCLASSGLTWCVLGLLSDHLGVSWSFWRAAAVNHHGFERFVYEGLKKLTICSNLGFPSWPFCLGGVEKMRCFIKPRSTLRFLSWPFRLRGVEKTHDE